MIPYMREKFGPRMFFAGNNYEWPRGSIHAGKIALHGVGGAVVGEEYCPIGVSLQEIEGLLDQVEAADPDVFVPYFAGSDQLTLLTRFTERGLKNRMAVVMGHYDEMMASKLSPEIREGFYSSNTYFMTLETPGNRNFLARLRDDPDVNGVWPDGNSILTNFGEGAYLCVKAFAAAANKAGTIEPEALVDTLATLRVESPQGVVEMMSKHHHARVNGYLSRCGADGVFRIVEEFGAIDPVFPERYSHQSIEDSSTLEEDFRLQARILELMSEGVLLVRAANETIAYANAGAERMFGVRPGEFLGQIISEIFSKDEAKPNNQFAEAFIALERKGSWQGEILRNGKDNIDGSCSLSATAFTHPVFGEVWLFVATDITERKQAEENLQETEVRLREILRIAPEVIISTDEDGNILMFNDAAEKTFG